MFDWRMVGHILWWKCDFWTARGDLFGLHTVTGGAGGESVRSVAGPDVVVGRHVNLISLSAKEMFQGVGEKIRRETDAFPGAGGGAVVQRVALHCGSPVVQHLPLHHQRVRGRRGDAGVRRNWWP